MIRLTPLTLFAIILMFLNIAAVSISQGKIKLEIVTGDNSEQYEVDLNSYLKQEINLTQSSRIKIQTKLTFSSQGFQPQFVSFRLRHDLYQNLTEPVLAQWESNDQIFYAVIDLGDPKHIRHLSGDYKLEIIVSDDRLDKQIRKYIANCKINFRYSLTDPLPSELKYTQPSIILTSAPAERIDPPELFTGFVVLVLLTLFGVFLWGLSYQGANFGLFPKDGTGMLLNLVFIGCLGLVLYMLLKFWLCWTFLETLQYFLIVLLPVSFVANYAFVHVRKEE